MSSTIPVNPVPPPTGDPIAVPSEEFRGSTLGEVVRWAKGQASRGFVGQTWLRWLTQQQQVSSAAAVRISDSGVLAGQFANIGATDISGGALSSGLYQVSAYAEITTAAGVSSSLTVTIGWTHNAKAITEAFPAVTGNTVTSVLTGASKTFRIDSNSPVTYATTYASNPATVMQYSLQVILVRLFA